LIGGQRLDSLGCVVQWDKVLRGALALTALMVAEPAAAETIVTAGSTSATWTAAGSPYVVAAQVTFETLTVEAGTVVHGATEDPPAIDVTGALVVNGTDEAPVVFEKQVPGSMVDTWGGIRAARFDVTGAVFRNAYYGLLGGPATSSRVSRSTFDTNYWAIEPRGGLVVDRVTFVGNGTAIFGGTGTGPYQVTVTNATVTGGNAFVFLNTFGTIAVSSSTFVETHAPIASENPATLRNSIVTNSSFSGVQGPEISHSILWMTPASPSSVTFGDGVLRQDPGLVSDTDFRLRPGSPAIDSGSPTGAPDHDMNGHPRPLGNGFDMGAFEYSPDGDGGAGGEGGGGSGGAAGAGGESGEGGNAGTSTGGEAGDGALGGSSGTTGGGDARGGSGAGVAGGETGGSAGTSAPSGGSGGRRPKKTTTSEGCGCRTTGDSPRGGGLATLGALALAAFVVRRRSRASLSA
jgi:MYXO-CTERM domain-containing protein